MAEDVSATDLTGLSEAEATARLRVEGHNELPSPERRTPIRIALDVLREPMLALLLSGGVIYLLLGDLQEALLLLGFGAMSIVITIVQETRTERVLEALRDLTSPRALVMRDGVRRRIAGRDVVRGDLIILGDGDRVPADAVLLDSHDLQVDESLLTGESVPVRKQVVETDAVAEHRPGGDDQPFVYSGSLVVRGEGAARVTSTGPRSEIGKIGASLRTLQAEPPRLQQQTARLVRFCFFGGAAVSIVAVLLYGTLRGDWLQALLSGVAIGMSMLPEEFGVVLTVFMAMGAWRISKVRVLTRRAAAIETLGSATVLCTDKTGTLTLNEMSVVELRLLDGSCMRPKSSNPGCVRPEFPEMLRYGVLASSPQPLDPMERALHALAGHVRKETSGQDVHGQLIHTYGLRPELLAMTQVWRSSPAEEYVVAAKGAPEAVARLCQLSRLDQESMRSAVGLMAEQGLRVLGIAAAVHKGNQLPCSQEAFAFRFLGLVGFADPLRPGVPAAVRECRSAGIGVAMITGDYPITAAAIAKQAGLDVHEVITGNQIKLMSDLQLAELVRRVNVFARVLPEQKLRIVQAMKQNGEIVAMTGDGVNDAPSLKAAHIGIAMGGRGTDVAREASSIVLLDDDFSAIISAIRLGRRIYDNLRKAMAFIFAVHVPIAGLTLLPLVFGLPLILGPVHIAFLELIIDPVCSLVFEAEREERDVMARPPRRADSPLFTWTLVSWSVLQGALIFVLVAVLFVIALHAGMPADEVRALAFFALIGSIVGLVLVNRSFSSSFLSAFFRPNLALAVILLSIAGALGTALLWPPASSLFRFGPLHPDDLMIALGPGVAMLVVLELLKPLWRRRLRS
ncbi:Ca2+-transporting ATPase [Bradyrhizobium japonicum]|nr:cation-translocating P-type ATPase [Bradyrhizobium elkanii]MDH6688450.1 Ca2+-transporting ATPase [Bradyrhizobium elkanii]UQD82521.1 cation-translocating P-type ATPase [Bradyrhizobium elkanii USDA 76]WLA85994.1 cation-translocating P-type ATPase [Bradyrhizobium elkanii]WLA91045.1 cation-translocating P-type ATPase [Bradyrhizobium elkanii]